MVGAANLSNDNIIGTKEPSNKGVKVSKNGKKITLTEDFEDSTFSLSGKYSSAVTLNASAVLLALNITGNNFSNRITGSPQADTINGGAGADIIYDGKDGDSIFGGADDDELHGGIGADTLWGGAGDDKLYGNDGADVSTTEREKAAISFSATRRYLIKLFWAAAQSAIFTPTEITT